MKIFGIAALLIHASSAHAGPSWAKVDDQDGIIVYECQEQGLGTVSFRGEGWIDADVKDIVNVMANNQEAEEWMPLVAEKRDLRQVSDVERVEYTRIKMPWPLTDRYFINQGKAEYLANGEVRLSIRSVDESLADAGDLVLGTLNYSEFLLTPDPSSQRTHLTLEVNSDPKGIIPKWIVNLAQKTWPHDFITGLIRQLSKHGKLRVATSEK